MASTIIIFNLHLSSLSLTSFSLLSLSLISSHPENFGKKKTTKNHHHFHSSSFPLRFKGGEEKRMKEGKKRMNQVNRKESFSLPFLLSHSSKNFGRNSTEKGRRNQEKRRKKLRERRREDKEEEEEVVLSFELIWNDTFTSLGGKNNLLELLLKQFQTLSLSLCFFPTPSLPLSPSLWKEYYCKQTRQ